MVKLRFTHFPPYIRGRNIEFMSNLREIRSNLDIIVELLERQYFIELERIEWQRIVLYCKQYRKHWGLDPR